MLDTPNGVAQYQGITRTRRVFGNGDCKDRGFFPD
jgi:hypothetical protein